MPLMLWLLLLMTALPAGGEKKDRPSTQDIAKWKRLLQALRPAEDRLAARDALAKRQASAALALLRFRQSEQVWPLLRHNQDPSLRSYLIRDLGRSGVLPDVLIQRLEVETDVSARRALLLSLGGFTGEQLPADRRKPLIA